MKVLEKIDKYFYALFVMLVVMTGIIVYSLKTIFYSINLSTEIDNVDKSASLKIDKDKMEKALLTVEQKRIVKLELK